MTSPDEKPRWRYRFDNYGRAFVLLREAIELGQERQLSQLEREGIIQRFEYTWELVWQTLKDYLDYQGIIIDDVTPRSVIKAAYAANIISRGDDWMKALDARNKMSHTYNFKVFEQVIASIQDTFLDLFDEVYEILLVKCIEDE